MTKSPLVGYAFIIEDHAQTQSGWDMKLLFGGFIAVILLGLYGYAVYEAIMVVMCIGAFEAMLQNGFVGLFVASASEKTNAFRKLLMDKGENVNGAVERRRTQSFVYPINTCLLRA